MRDPAPRPENHAMETPRASLDGDAGPFPEEREEVSRAPRRPENHRIATPRESLDSAASPRQNRRLLARPENHAMTPRTSIGSGPGRRLSLASLREARRKCTLRQQLGCALAALIFLLALVGGIVALVLWKKSGAPGSLPGGACSGRQIEQGCAPGFCSSSGCTCIPNYDQIDGSHCAVPLANHKMSFFVYEVLGDDSNTNECSHGFAKAYSLQAVLWYLHNEVVNQSCPRAQNLTRVVRCRATVYNTEQPFLEWKGQFGPYTTFNKDGRCTSPACGKVWSKFGYVTGCLPWAPFMGGFSYGNASHLYSFPEEQYAGRKCATPDGSKNCTWSMEPAGEIRLDDLENISDYREFCAKGGKEYDKHSDAGKGCSFWNNQRSTLENAGRTARLQHLFQELPGHDRLPEPLCDSQNSACHYHEKCRNLSGNCCPASTGMMLACCGGSVEPQWASSILA
mmetsp:Transcript_31248/g.72276  ORF Transcript_31248/g.72276 Transcript_31248/m.72276 type:complete len:454 (+) Transcript_31248:40-1401(+)